MITKYDFSIPQNTVEFDINRLTNQIWKLIPMKENNESWETQLNTVIIEIAGLGEIFNSNPQFLILLSKLEGLLVKEEKIDFSVYRKTIFEAITLLREILGDKE